MSLIRVRRDRKREWIDAKKGRSTRGLLLLLVLVVGIIVYISLKY
jgi:hypothetical protein